MTVHEEPLLVVEEVVVLPRLEGNGFVLTFLSIRLVGNGDRRESIVYIVV